MRILSIDDHGLFREGLELLLMQIQPEATILHAATLDQGVAMLEKSPKPDIVFTDLGLPGSSGIDALVAVRGCAPHTPAIVLAASENANLVKSAIDQGASGYIFKSVGSKELSHALELILSGGVYLPAVAISMEPVTQADPIALESLSTRKRQVLKGLVRGLSNKQIGKELHISDETVKSHASEIYQILNVNNRTQVVYAIAQLGFDPG